MGCPDELFLSVPSCRQSGDIHFLPTRLPGLASYARHDCPVARSQDVPVPSAGSPKSKVGFASHVEKIHPQLQGDGPRGWIVCHLIQLSQLSYNDLPDPLQSPNSVPELRYRTYGIVLGRDPMGPASPTLLSSDEKPSGLRRTGTMPNPFTDSGRGACCRATQHLPRRTGEQHTY